MKKVSGMLQRYKSVPRAMKASFWFLICSFFQKGISVITTPIFTRLLSTSDYGVFNVFESWSSIITICITMNMYSGVYMQGIVKYDKERSEFSSSLQGLTLTLVIFWSIVYFLFKDFWNTTFGLTTIQMTAILVMVWTTAVFGFWSVEQRVLCNYKLLVFITIAVSLLKPIVGILLVLNFTDKVTARIVGLAIVELFAYTIFFFVHQRKGRVFFSRKYWWYALTFAVPLIPHYLSQIVLNSADRIMISNMVGESQAGIYGLAYSVSRMMVLFNTALLATISPWIFQKIKEKEIGNISKIIYPAFLGISLVNIILIILAPEIIGFFAPPDYYEAIWIIPPVALSSIFTFAYNIFSAFEFYYKKSVWISVASVVGAVLNIILNFIFIKIFGYIAAGYTTLACYIIYAAMHYIFMNKVCDEELNGMRPYNGFLLLSFGVLIVLLGLLFSLTYTNSLLRYSFVVVLLFVGIYFRRNVVQFIRNLLSIKPKRNVE